MAQKTPKVTPKSEPTAGAPDDHEQGSLLSISNVVALGTETFSMNGVHKTVHCVVKNHPLEVFLKLKSSNFHKVGIDATLLYDTDELKPVDFVRVRPMEVKTRHSKDPSEAVIVSTIRVLSSQHEDMFFRILYTGIDRATGEEVPGMKLLSPSVKVISKPEQLNKPKERQKRKRPLNQEIVDQLAKIEQHQSDQKKALENIASQVAKNEAFFSSLNSVGSPGVNTVSSMLSSLGCSSPVSLPVSSPVASPPSPHDLNAPSSPQTSVPPVGSEDAIQFYLNGLIQSYTALPLPERPRKMRRIMKELDEPDCLALREIAASTVDPCNDLQGDLHHHDVPFSPGSSSDEQTSELLSSPRLAEEPGFAWDSYSSGSSGSVGLR